jgi:hypothetical protein
MGNREYDISFEFGEKMMSPLAKLSKEMNTDLTKQAGIDSLENLKTGSQLILDRSGK